MRIAVIDGYGGGIGSAIVKRVKEEFGEKIEIIALGTNAIATTQMMKAGANKGATGENAIVYNCKQVDVIIGSLGIVLAHGMMGEVTPKMAEAVSASPARKLLLPLVQENVEILGVAGEPLPHLVEDIIKKYIKEMMENV
ncbi:MAG: DUF3842 family protein [Candidatus Desulfofervidaceae bacterium]|nr:DUF3842 family protein [Candidatus Desulfofervidaceae bacterium]MDL1971420.1 DUF3842 family protein [Candidatus Desulfofervidaceae bacterium]